MARQYVSEPLECVAVFPCLMKMGRRTAHWDYLHASSTALIPVERDFQNGVFLSEAIVEGRYIRNNRLSSTGELS